MNSNVEVLSAMLFSVWQLDCVPATACKRYVENVLQPPTDSDPLKALTSQTQTTCIWSQDVWWPTNASTPQTGRQWMNTKWEMLTSRYCRRALVRLGRRYNPSVMCAACCKKAESLVPTIQVSITTPCLCTCKIVIVSNNIKDSVNDNDNDIGNSNNKNKDKNENKNNSDDNHNTNHSYYNAFWLRARYMQGKSCVSTAACSVHPQTSYKYDFKQHKWSHSVSKHLAGSTGMKGCGMNSTVQWSAQVQGEPVARQAF